ncbi:urease subunit alpha [Aquipuribacter hungaricus]|uniref:Urease subunit alpha n=1 Tax=Aquipuribacter hungaricus TaxID=545624 RepID=A0ABV7WL31_9MICO
MTSIPRRTYAALYGPTTGDRFRLADTNLIAQVQASLLVPGEETIYGGGKTLRDGMGQVPGLRNADGVLDTVITAVVVMDPVLGIVKADIGIKDGRIAGIGKAGNPYVQDGVHPNLVVGAGTEAISGEGLVATAGAIDPHVHFVTPAQVPHALSAGVTTLIGGGTGPADGSKGVTATPGPWNIARMLEATATLPVNVGLLAKGNSSAPATLVEQLTAGACGLKVHEDYGATPAVIDCALSVADAHDVQVAIHTDSLNESGYLADTVDAIDGRVIHSYHTEGAGGGHAPDVMAIAALPNVLPSSTNPTRPYTTDTTDNLFYMTMVTHHLNPQNPEDVAFAQSRIRGETEAAEDVLQDMGVISMMSSDSQAMGRIGDTVTTTWRTADKMKRQRGKLPGDPGGSGEHDNERILRYLAKYTINPALTHGIAHLVGSLETGKVADIVLWPTNTFGVKPKYVLKGGFVAWSVMGDPNASIPTPEPVLLRPSFGTIGKAVGRTSMTFVSQASIDAGVPERLGLERWVEPVRGCRTLGKAAMVRNDATPDIRVDPETYQVYVDGELVDVEPADSVPMSQLYNIV